MRLRYARRRRISARPRRSSSGQPARRTRPSNCAGVRGRGHACATPRRSARETRRDARAATGRRQVADDQPTVDEEEIAQVVSMWTGIPVTRIAQEESERLLHMEDASAQARDRPAGGDRDHLARPCAARAPASRTRSGPSARSSSWAPPAWARRSWPRPGRVHVRLGGRAHQDRHERVHGAPQREPAGRRPSRLRRLRRRRPADRGGPAQELRGGPARRDREGPSGGLQHPAADPGGRPAHRRQGPPGRLPQHDHHHDRRTLGPDSSRRTRRSASGRSARRKRPAPRRPYDRMQDKVQAELKTTFRPEFLNRIDADGRLPLADGRTRSG